VSTPHVQAYIDGAWTDGSAGVSEYTAAYDGSVLGTFTICDAPDVQRAIAAAKKAQADWAAVPLLDKVDLLYRAYDLCAGPRRTCCGSVVWKPSEFCPGSTARYAQVLHDAGFPPGVFNFVPGFGDAGAAIVETTTVASWTSLRRGQAR